MIERRTIFTDSPAMIFAPSAHAILPNAIVSNMYSPVSLPPLDHSIYFVTSFGVTANVGRTNLEHR